MTPYIKTKQITNRTGKLMEYKEVEEEHDRERDVEVLAGAAAAVDEPLKEPSSEGKNSAR